MLVVSILMGVVGRPLNVHHSQLSVARWSVGRYPVLVVNCYLLVIRYQLPYYSVGLFSLRLTNSTVSHLHNIPASQLPAVSVESVIR